MSPLTFAEFEAKLTPELETLLMKEWAPWFIRTAPELKSRSAEIRAALLALADRCEQGEFSSLLDFPRAISPVFGPPELGQAETNANPSLNRMVYRVVFSAAGTNHPEHPWTRFFREEK